MDLLDFTGEDLYFDQPLSGELDQLLQQAAQNYGTELAERDLLTAYFKEPENFTVLVALYRYFYYQHRYEDALRVAERTLVIVASQLGINRDWRQINDMDLAYGVRQSMAVMRFFLYALKGAGYLHLRLGNYQGALDRLQKVVDLDVSDRIGATSLRELAQDRLAEQTKVSAVA